MIKIALVDDHQMFRDGLRSVLSGKNKMEIVLECENGQEFLDFKKDDLDLAIMDLDMPEFNGLQTIEALRQRKEDVKVIFVSQNREAGMIGRLMELGARGYLPKDSKTEELIEAIRSVHETGYYFSDLVSQSMLAKLAEKDEISPKFNNGESLTDRETEVLRLICEELTTQEIGEKLFLSPKTVENHRSRIMSKTGARNSAGLVMYAIKNKVVDAG